MTEPPVLRHIARWDGTDGGFVPASYNPRPGETLTLKAFVETDGDGEPLVVGGFYWARPEFDVDSDDPDGWDQGEQPARFNGYFNDALGETCWTWLGIENDEWPARWIGTRIRPPQEASASS